MMIPIKGHNGFLIDDSGRIFSCWKRVGLPGRRGTQMINTGRVVKEVKSRLDKDGYARVTLCRHKEFAVHQLMLESNGFPRPSASHITRHLNGRRDDNTILNLAWGTVSENSRDMVLHGTIEGAQSARAKLTNEQALEIFNNPNLPSKVFTERYGVSKSIVCHIRHGRTYNVVTGLVKKRWQSHG